MAKVNKSTRWYKVRRFSFQFEWPTLVENVYYTERYEDAVDKYREWLDLGCSGNDSVRVEMITYNAYDLVEYYDNTHNIPHDVGESYLDITVFDYGTLAAILECCSEMFIIDVKSYDFNPSKGGV